MVKVRTGRLDSACISATTVDESMPPDRNAPTGTSAIMRRRTESRKKRVERLDRFAAVDPVAAALRGDVFDPPIAFDDGLTARL